ncbi:hypothetical protein BGZ83_000526 [Gryganskiella cystojenkinii]|nr:hypothetical protein BGZ83_000526 [Gryganskiella cystojenkinii]
MSNDYSSNKTTTSASNLLDEASSLTLDMDESDRYRNPSRTSSSSSFTNPDTNGSSSVAAAAGGTNNGYRRYSMGESGNESASDTTALQSNQHVKRTNSFTKNVKPTNKKVGFDPDRILFQAADDDDLEMDVSNGEIYNLQEQSSSRSKSKKSPSTQPKRKGDYGRISHDSFHSGYSEDHDDEDDGDRNDFGHEEEEVGMMTGSRTNRSGIGNGGGGQGHDNGDAKLPGQGGSIFNSFLNMANSIIGADWTVGLLVHNGKLSGRQTYQDLLMFCFGKAGLIMISIFQFIFAFGAMAAYTVIVGDTLPHVLQALVPGIETWPFLGFIARRTFVITFCTVLISFPLSLYRDISKLAKTSAVAMLALVVIIIAVMIEGPQTSLDIRGDPNLVLSFARPKLFQSIGVISFAFVCHHNSFLIFGSLQKPTMNRFKLVTHISMAVSLLACLILALSGYLVFSDKTQGNILNNFPKDNFIINIARFCFGVNMFTTLPLETFVCREVIETYYFAGEPFNMKRHFIITTSLVGAALVIALMTCNLGFVLEVTGGFSATALAFILPPLCYLKLASGSIWTVAKIPHLACLVFGVAVMVLSTFFSLQHFMSPPDASASQCSV